MLRKAYSHLSNDDPRGSADVNDNMRILMKQLSRMAIIFTLALPLSGCLGLVVSSAVDVGIAVAKIPFKVAKAAVSVVTNDDDKKK